MTGEADGHEARFIIKDDDSLLVIASVHRKKPGEQNLKEAEALDDIKVL